MDRLDKIDMSPEAVERRLEEMRQLWKLGNELRKAKYLGPVNPAQDLEINDESMQYMNSDVKINE